MAWTEGMFLRPQHFQHQETVAEERLRYHLSTVDPFHWGVRELVIDEDALSDHRFAILRLEALLPGGTILRHPGNAVVQSREFRPSAEPIDVHLGIHHLTAAAPNMTPRGDGPLDVRYLLEAREISDLSAGGNDSSVDLVYPNVRVFLSGEENALELHETFKVAEIVPTGELKRPFALSPSYAPPLLSLQASGLLSEAVGKIVSQIAAKVRVVAGRTTTIAVGDLPRMWMRYTLARMTPVLRHLLSTGNTRPFDLYTALVETAGSLAAFRSDEAAELPAYDHEALYPCFRALIDFIDLQLGEALPQRFREIKLPFDRAKKLYATDELNTDLVAPRNLFYLAVKADMPSAELNELVVQHGKAGSRAGVPSLVMLNVQGLKLGHLPAAPTEIAGPPGFEYYRLEPHGAQWNKVREEFAFAVSLGKLETADARLYVVQPPAS